MKKVLLSVFALAAVAANAGLIEQVPVRQHIPTNAPVQVSAVQAPMKALRSNAPLKAISLDQLLGTRVQTNIPIEEAAYPACNMLTVTVGTQENEIIFDKFLNLDDAKIKATVNLNDKKISIAPGQVTYKNPQLGGDCKMFAISVDEQGKVSKLETPIEGVIDETTSQIHITTPFATFIMSGQYAGQYFGDLIFGSSMIELSNASMVNTAKKNSGESTDESDVLVSQNEDKTEAYVANFADKGVLLKMVMKEDKTVEIPVQALLDAGDKYGVFSFAVITGDDENGDPIYGNGPLVGQGTDTQVTFNGTWTLQSTKGYFMFRNYNTSLTMKDGFTLNYPGQEPSAVNDVNTSKTVASTTYVNLAGQSSTAPFDGVNIVVTRYTDGTQVAAKIIK